MLNEKVKLLCTKAGASLHPEQGTAVTQPKKRPTPEKSVLVIGDKVLRQLRMKILAQLPKKSSVVIRAIGGADVGTVKRETREFLEANPQQVHVVLHFGYEECMNFKKDELIRGISELTSECKRGNVSFSIATMQQFTQECCEANNKLTSNEASSGVDVLDMTFAHRQMVLRQNYSYAPEDIAAACSKTIARRAAGFLGTELKPLKTRANQLAAEVQQPPAQPPWTIQTRRSSRQKLSDPTRQRVDVATRDAATGRRGRTTEAPVSAQNRWKTDSRRRIRLSIDLRWEQTDRECRSPFKRTFRRLID